MEADITDEQEAVLINLVVKQKHWTGAQSGMSNFSLVETMKRRQDTTILLIMTMPFPKTREEAEADFKRRNMWLDPKGLAMLGSLNQGRSHMDGG